MNCLERLRRCGTGLLWLLLATGGALAATPIRSIVLSAPDGRIRLVVESTSQLRFTLLVLRYPNRVVLELENAALAEVQVALAKGRLSERPVLVKPSPGHAGTVQLEFELASEAEPSIRALKPQAGKGYQLVLDLVPLTTPERAPQGDPVSGQQNSTAHSPTSPLPASPGASDPLSRPVIAISAAAQASAGPMSRRDENDLMLLEVRLEELVLADTLPSYRFGGATFLPLGELSRLLTLAIRTQPDRGTAEGFVLSESRIFNLNVNSARLTLADQTQAFDPALVQLLGDDIYVESGLLSRWLPLDFRIDLASLTLRVRPRERLPLQDRLERERLASQPAGRIGYEDPGYPRQDLPYRLLGTPLIDQSVGVGLTTGSGKRQTSANYTAYLTGDVLGLESAWFVSTSHDKPSPDLRFTLARHDPDAGLLGPIRARSVMFGNGVSAPVVPNIASASQVGKGYGLLLSNRPFSLPLSFDRHTLRGDLPPGWDVELYFNEALVGLQAARPDGLYSFDDLPLIYGRNEFRLVFHGPLGQQRVERQSFLLDQSSTPPGAFYYTVAQHQHGADGARLIGQFEWGVNKSITATGGFVRLGRLSGSGSPEGQLYTNLGFRSFLHSFIVGNEFYKSSAGGWLNETWVKTGFGATALSYSHTQMKDFSSEVFLPTFDPLRTRDQFRIDSVMPSIGPLPRLPATLELLREQTGSGRTNLTFTNRLSASVNRFLITNQLTWQRFAETTSAAGTLNMSRRVADVGLSAQLGYSIKPETKIDIVALAAEKHLKEGYLLNLGLVRSIAGRETIYTGSLNKSLGRYGLGVSASYSDRGVLAVGLQLFIAMGQEPRQGRWRFDAFPRADGGAASARVFLDTNANGIMDPGEEPIENAALTINGGRTAVRTNAAGIAWLDRLPIRQGVDIAVDAQTLEDPYWAPRQRGVRVVPRPGRVAELDFPIVLTSEIDGTVYVVEGTTKRGIGDAVIELLDANRKLLSTTKSSSDGYFIVPAVVQGRYYLRVAPTLLQQYGFSDPGDRLITISADGKFENGIDFLLRKKSGEEGVTR